MSELLREIEEDMRSERMHRLWDRFGKTLIGISVAILLGTAGGVAWKHYQRSQAMDRTSQLLAASELMADGRYKDAITVFDKLIGDNSVYSDMALLQKGQAEEALANGEAAAKTYQELANRKANNAFVAMGKLLAAKETDTPMLVADDAPFVHLQKEMRGWQLLNAGKREEAILLFSELRDDDATPNALRARAHAVVSTLQVSADE